MVQLDRNFMVKHRDFAVELPKLNVVTIKKPFCAFHGLGIVGAIERHRPVEMAVRTDEVSAVFRHVTMSASELAFRL